MVQVFDSAAFRTDEDGIPCPCARGVERFDLYAAFAVAEGADLAGVAFGLFFDLHDGDPARYL